jgi:glucan phosphoethanolaminetransferase (alkaline phosphatase superfamily)
MRSDPHRPNIVIMLMDTTRADHLSLYGYHRRTSPHLEAIAREGA